jgi:SOS-response transcriptional repressor LexA
LAIRGRRNRRFIFEDATVEYRRHSTLPFLGGSPRVSPLINLSVGGLQFVSDDYFDPGQRLDLKVVIPSAFRSITLRGEVVWARRVANREVYRTGVRHIDPSSDDVALLRALEEQYWAIPDERKQQLEAAANERYPLQGADRPARRPPEAAAAEPETETEEPEAVQTAPDQAPPEPAQEQARAAAAVATAPETAAEETPEPEPESPEPAPAPEPCEIPVYDLITAVRQTEEGPAELDGVVQGHLTVPTGADAAWFGLEIHDDSMHQLGAPSFERGDIVVFSRDVPARSGDLTFAVVGNEGIFRQVFLEANERVRLRPLNGWHREQTLDHSDVQGLWRLVATLKFHSEG